MKHYALVAFAFAPWIILLFVTIVWLAGGFERPAGQAVALAPTLPPQTAVAPPSAVPATVTREPTPAPTQTLPPAVETPTANATQIAASYPCEPGLVKANRKSMIYHLPGQRDYARFRTGVTCILNEQMAIANGYRKAER